MRISLIALLLALIAMPGAKELSGTVLSSLVDTQGDCGDCNPVQDCERPTGCTDSELEHHCSAHGSIVFVQAASQASPPPPQMLLKPHIANRALPGSEFIAQLLRPPIA